MNDHASASSDDSFTPEEQAAFDAYERGEESPAAAAQEPAGGDAAPAGADVAPDAAAPAAAAPGERAAAPGDVVDPDDEGADDPEANKGRFVRHGAFHKERERRKSVERQFHELQERYTRGDERMRLLNEALQRAPQTPAAASAAPAEPEAPIDPSQDIFGAYGQLKAELDALRTGQQQVSEAHQQEAEARRAADERQAVISAFQQDAARVAQTDPTFMDAYQHLVGARVAELKLYGLDDKQAATQANADELALVHSALRRGVSPAEMMVQLAKSRGWSAKAPEPAAPAAPAETAADKAARTAQGQAGPGRSLSAAGGGPAGEVTVEMLASMSDADFEKFAASSPKKLAALMGAAA